MLFTKAVSGLALLAGLVAAHLGHDVQQEAAERRAYLQSAKRTSLAHCADKLRARGIEARNIARRQAVVEKARQKRSIKKRDFDTVISTSHNKTGLGYTQNTDAATLFAGYNSCLLAPEVTQGPYYVAGEYVRENIVDDEPGVSFLVEYQVIDVATCDPVPDVYVEMWHCNSTGVYSGVAANGNGNGADTTNLDNTALRGIQPTDDDGVAIFESVFPGHYTGRTTHVHVMVHANATTDTALLSNGTLGLDTYASHVGQAFFDQALITAMDEIEPYASNTAVVTLNEDDSIMQEGAATDGLDPVMEYTLLGDDLGDGLFAWIAFGVDTTQSNSVSPAAYYQEGGGVTNEDSNMGGGPGGSAFPSDGGTPPSGSGAPPSGAVPTGTATDAASSAAGSSAVAVSNSTLSSSAVPVVNSSAASPGRGSSCGRGNGRGRQQN
ncbi:aromatic compound dioxygenase [Parathielavia hyrcaniae]|uniref:Aromatic compound dioxygenase n=1 Tax=Parathielavia hyrcaniae TaxID=113614 RepID=A0AAN6Q245_9PEZI|nr:aromatic compound dioxygenase [Parathielavia hyrcaniae]